MPNQDALTLARVAIGAQKRYCEVYVPSHYREHGLFGKSGVLISPEDFIAAAIDRHMEREGTLVSSLIQGRKVDSFYHNGQEMPCPMPGIDFDYLYRITQEPRGGEDGE